MPRGFRVWDKQTKSYELDREFVLGSSGELMELCSNHNGTWEYHFADTNRFIIEFDTGLKDKNGKEIHEGDIVFFFTEHFDKATGGFDGEDEHNATVEWFDNGLAFMDKIPYDPNIECEVIGNIHENKELLEGGDGAVSE